MKKLLLLTAAVGIFALTGCETHEHHARYDRRDDDHYRHAGYPAERRYEPVPVYREYPEYRR